MSIANNDCENHIPEESTWGHPTIHIKYHGEEADIDEQIAPLILEMWKAGIETCNSCQNEPNGWIWIQFASSWGMETFLTAIADYSPNVGSLYDRMLHGYDRISGPRVGQWRYETIIVDIATDEYGRPIKDVQGICDEPPAFMVLLSVNFPKTDLPEVIKRMKRFNRQQT
jgi:hypothetical protein